ncbi:MAG: HYR domain-containing protein [Deltaproteobacteria bacterium]|nr:HYR domain-containing protein [Deltaproteobacteria bacterium]
MAILPRTRSRIEKLAACLLAALLILPGTARAASTTYTTNAQFDLGTLDGVNHDAPNNDQLQLNVTGTTFSVLWVANAGHDTVSKIDTAKPSGYIPSGGCEVARYRTWFGTSNHGAWDGPAPSRTAVDIEGNVYVANRHFDGRPAQVMKILAEGGIDRNGNGTIDTSSDANNDCQISASEMAPVMVDSNGNGKIDPNEITDERIAWVVTVGPNNGLGRSLCIGTDGHIWVGLYNARQYWKISAADGSVLAGPVNTTGNQTPYGCLVDAQGRLWSAGLSTLLGELNTNTNTWTATRSGPRSNYGIALGNNKVYLGSSTHQYDPATNTFSLFAGGQSTLGLSVDGNGDILLGQGRAAKYTPAGGLVWSTVGPGASDTRGVVPDQNNDVWIVNRGSNNVMKFRGTDGAFLGTLPVGREPYTYSDATGFAARNVTTPTGTWTVTKDSGDAGTIWNQIIWNDSAPAGATVAVKVRAADTEGGLSLQPYITVSNGGNPGVTGQFIQIQARLTANSDDESPILYDLTVAGVPPNQPPVAQCQNVTVAAGDSCNATASVNNGSYDPDGDAITLSQTPAGPYGLGTTPATLTVTDTKNASDSCTATVTVVDTAPPGITCPVAQSVECTGSSSATATFSASATDNCSVGTPSCNPVSGSSFSLGTTTVACSATDGSGNTSSCSSSVTVVDTTPPSISCPAPITTECTSPNGAFVTPGVASASDICAGVTVAGPAAGTYPIGSTTVTYTATDGVGLQNSCQATIQVVDTTKPVVSCVESVNPSGKNVPKASNTNQDGFYKVSGSDICSAPTIKIGSYVLASGETIKITQTPGKSGVSLVNTMGPLAIKHFQVGPGDAVITATDGSGNSSSVTCLVPPPPK